MRLKVYRGAGMPQALAEIRAELGADAMILSTRRIAGGIEVTAAAEEVPRPECEPAQAGYAPRVSPELDLDAAGRDLMLGYHGVTAGLSAMLMAGPLPLALATALRFKALPTGAGGRPILVVGPPGGGKTLTVARLATRLVLAGIAPLVISADGQRAGAVEQLGAFTALLGVNLLVASKPAAIARALARREADAPVLIDAPGIDALDPDARAEMAALASVACAAMLVVVPGGIDPVEAHEIAEAFVTVGAGMMVANRLDISRRLGGVLAAAHGGLALAEAGIGSAAADGLVPMTASWLADRMRRSGVPR